MEFLESYNRLLPSNQQDIYAAFAYDAVYAIALALNKSETDLMMHNKTLQDFTYNDVQMAQIFRANMQNLLFEGITVSFIQKAHWIKIVFKPF